MFREISKMFLHRLPTTPISASAEGWYGDDIIVAEDLDLGADDSCKGFMYLAGDGGASYDQRGWITKNNKKAIQVHNLGGYPINKNGFGNNLLINDNYIWYGNNTQQLFCLDCNLPDGTAHPTGFTSLNTKYRLSRNINGRNYVADVKIKSGTEEESHGNWVMYSELNQPDVIPITNYISIDDAQGGKIVGLESLLGDLVVLMENGIFRLSIPAADPTSWSLSESEENIGCISSDSITRYEGGMFFAGQDHLYYLNANFQAIPITQTIKDEYQSLTTSDTRTFYEPKKNRLLCRFGADGSTIYTLELGEIPKEQWSKQVLGDDMDVFVKDENSNIRSYDRTTQNIRLHDDSGQENVSFLRTTGWFSFRDLDDSQALKRLNVKYKSGDDLTVYFYTDGDDDTIANTATIPADTTGADWYKLNPMVRGRSFKIKITSPSSTKDVEIRRMEVDVE